jgi:hypothetical protein
MFFKNQNPNFNLMNFEFEFLNIHISDLTQLGMINITLKCQEKKTYVKKFIVFTKCYLTWFLAPISILAPFFNHGVMGCF